jgi:hypothetical protein
MPLAARLCARAARLCSRSLPDYVPKARLRRALVAVAAGDRAGLMARVFPVPQ